MDACALIHVYDVCLGNGAWIHKQTNQLVEWNTTLRHVSGQIRDPLQHILHIFAARSVESFCGPRWPERLC